MFSFFCFRFFSAKYIFIKQKNSPPTNKYKKTTREMRRKNLSNEKRKQKRRKHIEIYCFGKDVRKTQ